MIGISYATRILSQCMLLVKFPFVCNILVKCIYCVHNKCNNCFWQNSHSIWRYAGICNHTHSCQYSTQDNVIVW